MKVVHFSDWHGNWQRLPTADLYICTGDMLLNYVVKPRYKEIELQAKFLDNNAGCLVPFMASKDAKVVIVKGNHDFVPIAKLFDGMNVWEVDHDSSRITTLTLNDKTYVIGGFRGVPPISGNWADETFELELATAINKMPELDICISHGPPYNILDNDGNRRFGSTAFAGWLNRSTYENKKLPRLFAFGHIHEEGGYAMIKQSMACRFSNAATTFNVFDLEE